MNFTYRLMDGISAASDEALVVISVGCLRPLNFTYERPPGDAAWSPPRGLLEDLSVPSCPATVASITQQPAEGTVTLLGGNGNYTFTTLPGWAGAAALGACLLPWCVL